jgi:rubrerythrin
MTRQKSEKDLAGFLRYASILEEKTFTFYKGLSEIVKHPLARHLLLYIAYDSFKHSVLLRKIGEEIVTKEAKSHHEKSLDLLWKAATKMGEEIMEKQSINDRELCLLTSRLARYEASLSESYRFFAGAKTLKSIAKEIKKTHCGDAEFLKDIFELIIMDEDGHKEILTGIKELLKSPERQSITPDTPLVRYQNPDAWYRQG